MPPADAPDQIPEDAHRRWEHFAHDADIGIRGFGDSPAEAFEQGALALTAVVSDPARIRPGQAVSIRCRAPDIELLFVEWLNALVFEMTTGSVIFSRFAVSIEGDRLEGTAWGEGVDVARHRPAAEIKGATYTELRVERGEDGIWIAQCVVDV